MVEVLIFIFLFPYLYHEQSRGFFKIDLLISSLHIYLKILTYLSTVHLYFPYTSIFHFYICNINSGGGLPFLSVYIYVYLAVYMYICNIDRRGFSTLSFCLSVHRFYHMYLSIGISVWGGYG